MLLMPRRVKHRKQHRGRRKGVAMRGNEIAFGQYGLQAQGACVVTLGETQVLATCTSAGMRRSVGNNEKRGS